MDLSVNRQRTPGADRDCLQTAAADSDTASIEAREAQMRRALGRLGPDSPERTPSGRERPAPEHRQAYPGSRPRHRFVADGEVPVVMMHSAHDSTGSAARAADSALADRLHATETALREERAGREAAERSLQAAQATIHDLQTKLGHASLAQAEAVAALRQREEDLRAAVQRAAEAAPRTIETPLAVSGTGRRRGRPPGSRTRPAIPLPGLEPPNPPPASAEPPDEAVDAAVATVPAPRKPAAKRGPKAVPEAEAQPVAWWIKGWRDSPGS